MRYPLTVEFSPNFAVIVDSDTWEQQLQNYRWRPLINRRADKVYAVTHLGTGDVSMHRMVMDVRIKGPHVDHQNGDTLDNQSTNLRIATPAQNRANSRKTRGNTSGYKGVTRAGKKWMAQIVVNGQRRYLGVYEHADRAAKAHDRAAIEAHGEFAGLNFEHLRNSYRIEDPNPVAPTLLRCPAAGCP